MRLEMMLVSGMAWILGGLLPAMADGQGGVKPIPSFAEVQRTVSRYFEAMTDYRSGDLITREQVEPLLAKLRRQGLPLADAPAILKRVPGKGDFIVDQLSTPAGRKFMRQIAKYPDAYDRVDRLARLPHGEQTVRDLIRGPDGYMMIAYMTTTPGGIEMGRMLENAPKGKDFNDPTRRIYTAAELLNLLQQSREAAIKAASKNSR